MIGIYNLGMNDDFIFSEGETDRDEFILCAKAMPHRDVWLIVKASGWSIPIIAFYRADLKCWRFENPKHNWSEVISWHILPGVFSDDILPNRILIPQPREFTLFVPVAVPVVY